MKRSLKILSILAALGVAGLSFGALMVAVAYLYVAPDLPSASALRDAKLQVPLRIYTRDGRLMAEFGDQRRIPVSYSSIPRDIHNAVLAAEDDRFYQHPGVDYQGILRAAFYVIKSGGQLSGQGGSTITMQVARNFFTLGRQTATEKTAIRKVREIFLALRIERDLSKEEILTLYVNKIFTGHRAYGFAAAAEFYYGKELDQLSLSETATLAGLLPAPSAYNPISHPSRAKVRRDYVLRRMLELNFIEQPDYEAALAEPVQASYHGPIMESSAPYVAEMIRAEVVKQFGAKSAYEDGYRVVSTIDSRLQQAAIDGLRKNLFEYDRRHGYRGHIGQVELPTEATEEDYVEFLRDVRQVADLQAAVVLAVGEETAEIYVSKFGVAEVPFAAVEWAKPFINESVVGEAPELISDVVAAGDLIYVQTHEEHGWRLAQIPGAQSAIVALDSNDGAIVALSGGLDFYASKFNRVQQARRQPGSALKPFIYSAALDNGFTAASMVLDAPVVVEDYVLEDIWRPKNYSKRFHGLTPLRDALIKSLNQVSIRVLQDIGIDTAMRYLERFGFPEDSLRRDLSLALGSPAISPLQLARGYAVFASGGHLVDPYYIQRIESAQGDVVFEADPVYVSEDPGLFYEGPDREDENDPEVYADAELPPPLPKTAPLVIEPDNAYIMSHMMKDVIRRGSGRRALQLGRSDLAGKTGTTNDEQDAWFSGFNRDLVATAWVGYDEVRTLGAGEQGGVTALPAWMELMGAALANAPERPLKQPPGIVTARISTESGLLAGVSDRNAVFEIFRAGNLPEQDFSDPIDDFQQEMVPGAEEPEPLF
ncbi:MAG: penicillin-binding protein 1A [Pseudomonadota bacterium]